MGWVKGMGILFVVLVGFKGFVRRWGRKGSTRGDEEGRKGGGDEGQT
jgi:hypothetical protein